MTTALAQSFRDRISELEQAMLDSGAPVVTHSREIGLTHSIIAGLYVRKVVIPKDLLCTTKIHLREHLAVVLRGDCSVLTEAGRTRVIGPCAFFTQPGTKRLIFAHEETEWMTVHAWSGDDPEQAERELVSDSYEGTL